MQSNRLRRGILSAKIRGKMSLDNLNSIRSIPEVIQFTIKQRSGKNPAQPA